MVLDLLTEGEQLCAHMPFVLEILAQEELVVAGFASSWPDRAMCSRCLRWRLLVDGRRSVPLGAAASPPPSSPGAAVGIALGLETELSGAAVALGSTASVVPSTV